MNANYIYDVFATTELNHDPDLMIGLAKLKVDKPIPKGTTEGEICDFIGRHYHALVAAYADHDRDAFAKVVAECEAADLEKEAE